MVTSGGLEVVSNGGTAIGAAIDSGGVITVTSGGMLSSGNVLTDTRRTGRHRHVLVWRDCALGQR